LKLFEQKEGNFIEIFWNHWVNGRQGGISMPENLQTGLLKKNWEGELKNRNDSPTHRV
jgi:hypothetical protein